MRRSQRAARSWRVVGKTGLCSGIGVLVAAAMLAAQAPAAPPVVEQTRSGTLVVAGAVSRPLVLAPEALRSMPRTAVTVERDGESSRYEGVLVGDLLERAGAPVGKALRGDAVATYVVASASDGYRAVFSLAELDPAFTGSAIIVADTVDGKPLFDYQGPLRIVAPKDLAGARSIRMLERLDVVSVPKP